MKKVIFCIIALLFVCCNSNQNKSTQSDENEETKQICPIVGKWKYSNEREITHEVWEKPNEIRKFEYLLEFDENDTVKYTKRITNSYVSGPHTDQIYGTTYIKVGTYQIEGNKITMKFDNKKNVDEDFGTDPYEYKNYSPFPTITIKDEKDEMIQVCSYNMSGDRLSLSHVYSDNNIVLPSDWNKFIP